MGGPGTIAGPCTGKIVYGDDQIALGTVVEEGAVEVDYIPAWSEGEAERVSYF